MEDNTTVKWGNTIFNDGTVAKRVVIKYDTITKFRNAWENRNRLTPATYEADIETLTIECREYVSADEYFTSVGEEE